MALSWCTEEDYYDNSNLSEDEVAAQRIIAFSAVMEQEKGLRLKVARIVRQRSGCPEHAYSTVRF